MSTKYEGTTEYNSKNNDLSNTKDVMRVILIRNFELEKNKHDLNESKYSILQVKNNDDYYLNNHKKTYPNATILLELKKNPNVVIFWNAIKQRSKDKLNIVNVDSMYGISFDLNDNYTEEDLMTCIVRFPQ